MAQKQLGNDSSLPGSTHVTPTNKLTAELNDLPVDMLCVVCQDARRCVVIVTCRHLVFCKKCVTDYALKHPNNTTCPICRKAYKQTIPVLFT
jgi:hypothetical protein